MNKLSQEEQEFDKQINEIRETIRNRYKNDYEIGKLITTDELTPWIFNQKYFKTILNKDNIKTPTWVLIIGKKSDGTNTLFECRKSRQGNWNIQCPKEEQIQGAKNLLPKVYKKIDLYNTGIKKKSNQNPAEALA